MTETETLRRPTDTGTAWIPAQTQAGQLWIPIPTGTTSETFGPTSGPTETQAPGPGTPTETQTPGPGPTETQAPGPGTPTETPIPGPGPTETSMAGPGPDLEQTETQTETGTQTQTGTRRARRVKVVVFRDGPGPVGTKTGTKTGTTKSSGLKHWIADGGYLTALTIVVAVVASLGQKVYAVQERFVDLIVIPGLDVDLTPWLAVGAFDLSVAALLHGGIRAARMNQSPWPWWIGAAIVGGLSIYTNTQHVGAWITASASGVLLVMWFLRMYGEYVNLTRTRRASAPPKLLTSTLMVVDRKLAYRAWVISTTKPLTAAVAYRRQLGEELTERDIAVLAARLYLQVHADMLYTEMNPHLTLNENKLPSAKKVRFWQHARKDRARQIAEMTAGDAVDQYLGLPVIDRQGIKPGRVTYAPMEQTPRMGAVRQDQAPDRQQDQAPDRQQDQAPDRQQDEAPDRQQDEAPDRQQDQAPDRQQDQAPDRQQDQAPPLPPPPGNLPTYRDLTQILQMISADVESLPAIDPNIVCECSRTKPCGRKLIDHVQRKGQYVVSVINTFSDWSTRVERIGKADIFTATGKSGGGLTNEMAGMFDHLRKLAQEQRTSADA